MERNRITVNFKFKIPLGLIGDLGELIAYRYLSQELGENENAVGFLIRGGAIRASRFSHSLSIPFQVIHALTSLSASVKKEKVEFNPEYRTIWRRGQYFLVGKDGVEIPQEDISYFKSVLRNRPQGTNPDVSFDLLSYSCNPPESIRTQLQTNSDSPRHCAGVSCPLLLRKLQQIFLKGKKKTKPQAGIHAELLRQWDEIRPLMEAYKPTPKKESDLTADEQAIIKDHFRFLSPRSHVSKVTINKETLPLSVAIPYILSGNSNGRFNQAVIDYELTCEYLNTLRLIEVKAITRGPTVFFTYAEIKTLQHVSSMNFEIDCSYRALVVNLAKFIQNQFEISVLDNQKILAAAQNKSKISKSYLKLLKDI